MDGFTPSAASRLAQRGAGGSLPNTTTVLHDILRAITTHEGSIRSVGPLVVEVLLRSGYLTAHPEGLTAVYWHQSEADDLFAYGFENGWRQAIRAQRQGGAVDTPEGFITNE